MTARTERGALATGRRSGRVLGLLAAATALVLVGCKDLLVVEDPQQVLASDLEKPEYAALMLSGAISDFHCAFGHFVLAGALLGNELTFAHSTAGQTDFDRRTLSPNGGWYASNGCGDAIAAYTPIARARWSADFVLGRLREWSDADVENRTRLIATAAAYSGYAHVLLGEGFCTGAVDAGPELTRTQIFELAEEKFTLALEAAQTAGASDIQNLARVGRARARRNLGRQTEAVADARLVPSTFVMNAVFSDASSRSRNKIFWEKNQSARSSVGEAYRGLTFGGVPDPRVPAVSLGRTGTDQQTVLWVTRKYPNASSPIRLASGVEAQLIIAELVGGQEAVGIINGFHDRVGLPHFQSDDPDEIRAQVREERARELFMEGHHLNDLIRFQAPFVPAVGAPYKHGGQYGDVRCMPLPDRERLNNPNIAGR